MADEDDKGYRWETEYEKTWEELQEDESGSLQASVEDILHRARRRQLLEKVTNVRLGMMRHLYIVIDASVTMADQDLKPARIAAAAKLLEFFVEEYFDQNPISQLGIVLSKCKRAEVLTELGGNPQRHKKCLQELSADNCKGEFSLQNSLELALSTLRHMPSHASREILVIMASLTTCDPGDIAMTIKAVADSNIRCSVIGLSAEVRVCKSLCQQTGGIYSVILDEPHFKDLLNQHITPPPALSNTESSLIKMGFPHHSLAADKDTEERPSMCMCHLDSKTYQGFSTSGYFCPQCKCKYCELPIECKACGLTLVSAPHLARSYHHLFPPEPFKELLTSDIISDGPVCIIVNGVKNISAWTVICTRTKRFIPALDVLVPEIYKTFKPQHQHEFQKIQSLLVLEMYNKFHFPTTVEEWMAIGKEFEEKWQFPTTVEEWMAIAKEFEEKWQFPNCLGSVDGKHVAVNPPANSGSYYYNYKGFHSLVMMAIANANYEFIYVHFGTNGRVSDGGVINCTEFYRRLLHGQLKLPPTPDKGLPFVFISDEAFTLREDFLKPYMSFKCLDDEKRIFNYHLSRAQRVVENAFGILVSKFRVLRSQINLQPQKLKIL